ncbi:MAG TPA: ISL3 family transposase [Candidatus Binatia bacterium]|nr:ISL3 family transposase [Candidatus Binatia bacterium]
MDLVACLLPAGPLLHLETWRLDEAAAQLTLYLTSTQALVHCPLCQCPTQHLHSHYTRTVADLPWAHLHVVFQVGVRKFFCANRRCTRRIFTERLPQLVAPWARRTQRLMQHLGSIAVALGGTAGALLRQQLGMSVSRNTLLRLLRRLSLPACATPTVLGVDDFALRKRQTYGTILVDQERHHPVALLPERTADTLAQWLREHPGVAVITRDRSSAYADGAHQGAPAATQVADRFHLIQNLAEALTEVFTTQRTALDAVNAAARQQPVPLPDGTLAVPLPPPATPPRAQQQAAQRAALRQATYDMVWALHRQGWTVPAIAAQVGHSRHTIERYLRLPTWPVPQHRSTYGRSVLNPYKDYLLARWNAGCRIAMQLFRELQQRGYTGSYRRVAAYASRLRQAQGLAPRRQGRRQTLPVVAEPAAPPLTPRRTTWLVLGREATRTEVEGQQLTQLHAQSAEVAEAIDLAQDFAQLVRQRQPASLDPWLQRAATSPLEGLRRFAQGLYEDYDAVKAGVTVPWSNGPAEGHINRLKMVKRQMFGRAHLDLLNRRFLLAPRHERAPAPHAEAAVAARAPPAAVHPLHQKWVAQFIGLCSSLKWSSRLTKSPFLALPATVGSNAAYKIISACSNAVS